VAGCSSVEHCPASCTCRSMAVVRARGSRVRHGAARARRSSEHVPRACKLAPTEGSGECQGGRRLLDWSSGGIFWVGRE
jgi:hypothetical protein